MHSLSFTSHNHTFTLSHITTIHSHWVTSQPYIHIESHHNHTFTLESHHNHAFTLSHMYTLLQLHLLPQPSCITCIVICGSPHAQSIHLREKKFWIIASRWVLPAPWSAASPSRGLSAGSSSGSYEQMKIQDKHIHPPTWISIKFTRITYLTIIHHLYMASP